MDESRRLGVTPEAARVSTGSLSLSDSDRTRCASSASTRLGAPPPLGCAAGDSNGASAAAPGVRAPSTAVTSGCDNRLERDTATPTAAGTADALTSVTPLTGAPVVSATTAVALASKRLGGAIAPAPPRGCASGDNSGAPAAAVALAEPAAASGCDSRRDERDPPVTPKAGTGMTPDGALTGAVAVGAATLAEAAAAVAETTAETGAALAVTTDADASDACDVTLMAVCAGAPAFIDGAPPTAPPLGKRRNGTAAPSTAASLTGPLFPRKSERAERPCTASLAATSAVARRSRAFFALMPNFTLINI